MVKCTTNLFTSVTPSHPMARHWQTNIHTHLHTCIHHIYLPHTSCTEHLILDNEQVSVECLHITLGGMVLTAKIKQHLQLVKGRQHNIAYSLQHMTIHSTLHCV